MVVALKEYSWRNIFKDYSWILNSNLEGLVEKLLGCLRNILEGDLYVVFVDFYERFGKML